MLERQIAYFCGDDHIRREVEIWREATPEERIAELADICRGGQFFLDRLDPTTLERMLRREPLPADSEALFVALRRAPR